jgi:predicted Rossmann fold nucleotide-binding protein DprA/Smf involved in DNA uptake
MLMKESLLSLPDSDSRYPTVLSAYLGPLTPGTITAQGDVALLDSRPLAIFCSARCPGSLIVQASDLAHALGDEGSPVIGGFHTPVERACLEILLRGRGPVILCPARGMYGTLPGLFRKPLSEGRLLVLSFFDQRADRMTVEMAEHRNHFVAALAARVLVVHAAAGGRTEALCRQIVAWGKPLYTIESAANANLVAVGALPAPAGAVRCLWEMLATGPD